MAKVNPIGNFFSRIAKSKLGQKIYKNILDPKKDTFWNNTMPLIETSVASLCYIGATAVQKNIDDKSKKAMQWQNVLSWAFSLVIAGSLNKGVTKVSKGIIKHLKPELMADAHKVTNGIQVGLPIAVVTLINRFILPTAFVPISSIIRDTVDKRENKKLDIKA
jgi:hypothetical protein